MENARPFASLLARLRREQGFETAYAFYQAREGRRWLNLSFANYVAIEKGRSLPKPWRVARLAQALGLPPGSEQARQLARTYLECLEGAGDLLKMAGLGEAKGPDLADVSLGEAAARQAVSQRMAHLTVAQWKAMVADAATYLCHVFLVNTPGWTPAAEIGRTLGLGRNKVRKALKSLAAQKIVELSGERARTRFAGKYLPHLPLLPETVAIRGAQQRYRREFAEARGKLRHCTQLTVRMPRSALERYAGHLERAVLLGSVFGDVEKGPDTAVFLIEGRVFEIFP